MRMCVDPGHGLPDPGAVGPSGLKEADVTLAVAQELAQLLRRAGAEVILTRTGPRSPTGRSSGPDLEARARTANEARAELFLSMHCNSAVNRDAHGTETWVYEQASPASVRAAQLVQAELVRATGLADRGVRRGNLYVLRRTSMPAILVELAFISNPQEEALLADPAWRRRAAEAIARGVLAWDRTRSQ